MVDRLPFPPLHFSALAAALLDRVDLLLPAWLPGGVQRGHEWQCGDINGGAGSSCSVNMQNGRWADFAAGTQGGDLLSLYAEQHGLSMGKAALQVAREYDLEDVAGVVVTASDRHASVAVPMAAPPAVLLKTPARQVDDAWATVVPVPDFAPKPSFWHVHRNNPERGSVNVMDHTAAYYVDGLLYGYVVRFLTGTGEKETLPYTWCTSARDGASAWKWKTWDEPRPLYMPAGVLPNSGAQPRTVVLVEGERKAQVLHDLLQAAVPDTYLVATWPGGCKAWRKANWAWLANSTVLLWPDCDSKREPLSKAQKQAVGDAIALAVAARAQPFLLEAKQPGMMAMRSIGALLRDTHYCRVQMLPVPAVGSVDDGWDSADAINVDGWDAERILQFFECAYDLIIDGGADAKKIDGPIKTDSTDDALAPAQVAEKIGGKDIPAWLLPYFDKPNKRWFVSRKMVILILERDTVLEPILAYNELSNNVQSRELWPWPHSKTGDVTDAVDLLLGKYLTDTYGLPSISRAALSEAIETVAHSRRFHPVREYLQNLPAHDGKSRIDNWLVHVIGESPETLLPAVFEYMQIVGRCWLLGMVNRVMRPGCKFDYCPVLEGVGGLRKSTMVEVLCSSEFYSDTPFEVGKGKEAQEQVQGLWLYEIAELTHFSKAEVGAIKAFVSSKIDRYRVAYGATVGTFPRQCILVGTTNENTYLRDRTGNRRFWPLPVRNIINTDWLSKYRDALFAEAFELYKQGAAYVPTPDQEKRLFVPMQESRLVETALMGELLHVLTRAAKTDGASSLVNCLAEFVTLAQLVKALDMDAIKATPAHESAIRSWLVNEGWTRCKKMVNGVRSWGYAKPAMWPPIDDLDTLAAPNGAAVLTTIQDDDDVPF